MNLLENVVSTLLKEDFKISFAYEEIDCIEDFYKKWLQYPNILKEKVDLKELAIIYFGEAFIFHAGGNWKISNVKREPAYGKPIILNWGTKDHVRVAPHEWLSQIEQGSLYDRISAIIKRLIILDKM